MKYMGSKSRIANKIVPIIQDYIDKNNVNTYIEPFVGGANVIDKVQCQYKIGNDIHSNLIALLEHVQKGRLLPDAITREEYSKVRSNPSDFDDWYVGCVGFLASYNGRYFDGGYAQSGYEKTKNGERYRDYYTESKNNLINQAKRSSFKDIRFENMDYIKCVKIFNPWNCVIYADPPYRNTKQFSNSKNFNHDEFWEIMRKLSDKNIVLVSELSAPDDWDCIWEQEVSRSIKVADKMKSTERLFIHKDSKYRLGE